MKDKEYHTPEWMIVVGMFVAPIVAIVLLVALYNYHHNAYGRPVYLGGGFLTVGLWLHFYPRVFGNGVQLVLMFLFWPIFLLALPVGLIRGVKRG